MIDEAILLSKIAAHPDRFGDDNIDEEYMNAYRYHTEASHRTDSSRYLGYMESEMGSDESE